MKKVKKSILLILSALILTASVTACSQNTVKSTNGETSSTESASNTQESVSTTAGDTVQDNDKEKTAAENEIPAKSADEKSSDQSTSKPQPKSDDKKSAGQSTTTTARHTTATKPSTTKKSETTTKKQTTTQKPTTTKKTTTTTTTKKQGLSKSDVEWVQSQGNAYIKSKGLTVDSSVGSFSGRISTLNYTNRNTLLDKVKEAINVEYQECIDAGWKQVNMYCKIESRDNGSYFIYVMYGC